MSAERKTWSYHASQDALTELQNLTWDAQRKLAELRPAVLAAMRTVRSRDTAELATDDFMKLLAESVRDMVCDDDILIDAINCAGEYFDGHPVGPASEWVTAVGGATTIPVLIPIAVAVRLPAGVA